MSRSNIIQQNISRSGGPLGSADFIMSEIYHRAGLSIVGSSALQRGMVFYGAAEAVAPRPGFDCPATTPFMIFRWPCHARRLLLSQYSKLKISPNTYKKTSYHPAA